MAEKHPYTSGISGLVQAVSQFRKTFPPVVTAETLRRLGIAPNNETYIIGILRYIGVLDQEGKGLPEARAVFSRHEDAEFSTAFAQLVENAYSDLFNLHGDGAWTLPTAKLISFFRTADGSSEIVGKRQASTFQALAALSGHAEVPTPKSNPARGQGRKTTAAKVAAAKDSQKPPKLNGDPANGSGAGTVGLTVRIEVNLPAGGDKETYDAIFKSIRENLLSGK